MNMHEGSPSTFPIEGKTLGPVEVPRLRQGALGLIDIATSTMANIAPAMSFFFSSAHHHRGSHCHRSAWQYPCRVLARDSVNRLVYHLHRENLWPPDGRYHDHRH
jgi:hypothetical protein